ncbi:MAG: hypothetical protein GAK35_02315 [Herbaspirillum frisingense]|uniref:Uncharacterized protein n=1 Tax=Herbaspirillum frisingense TaxID=92645 RepID=A0A7V8FWD3_9BURK|nr:MAG: hypothetical protein GAK35_02315 [Herbaspirillum frisingense]
MMPFITRRTESARLDRSAARLMRNVNAAYKPSEHLVGYPVGKQAIRAGAVRKGHAWLLTFALLAAYLAGYAAGDETRGANASTTETTQAASVCGFEDSADDATINQKGAD